MTIPEAEVLLDLIGTVYDTTLDQASWPAALKKVTEFVGGSASSLYAKSVSCKTGKATYHWNSKPNPTVIDYFGKYIKIDPVTACQFRFDVGQPYSVEDCIPYSEFVETPVYQEWARPQGWIDHLAVTLDKSTTGFSVFGIFRSEENGLVDDEMRRRMQLIIPHVRRAAAIGNVLDLGATESAALADTLNGLAAGVFLVDKNGRIVFVNASGQAMLDEATILCRVNDTLVAADPRARAILSSAVPYARDGDASVGGKGIAVPLSFPPDDIWLAHILPLTSGARLDIGLSHSAVAAVFVHQSSAGTPSAIEMMAKSYKLTPREARVLAAVSEIASVSTMAEVLGISQATVKTHLQRLFAKTGTNRQTELVKLMAAYSSPLRRIP